MFNITYLSRSSCLWGELGKYCKKVFSLDGVNHKVHFSFTHFQVVCFLLRKVKRSGNLGWNNQTFALNHTLKVKLFLFSLQHLLFCIWKVLFNYVMKMLQNLENVNIWDLLTAFKTFSKELRECNSGNARGNYQYFCIQSLQIQTLSV